MSGVVITASGVDASANNIGLVLPYATNCEAFGILGGTAARSQKKLRTRENRLCISWVSYNFCQFCSASKCQQMVANVCC